MPSLNLGCLLSYVIILHPFIGCLPLSSMGLLYLCYLSAASSTNGLNITIMSQISNSGTSPIWCASNPPVSPQFRELLRLTKPFARKRPCFWNASIAVKPRSFFQSHASTLERQRCEKEVQVLSSMAGHRQRRLTNAACYLHFPADVLVNGPHSKRNDTVPFALEAAGLQGSSLGLCSSHLASIILVPLSDPLLTAVAVEEWDGWSIARHDDEHVN